jgi:prevent-host-death family protein
MQTVNIHEAKTHLSKLIAKTAANGEPFIIAKAGKPMVKVVPIDAPEPRKMRRIGFGDGKSKIPDDFDTMFEKEIEELFYGKP